MKSTSFGTRLLQGAIKTAAVLLLLPLLLLYSFHSRIERYADLWQQLGIQEKNGSEMVRESFLNGYLQYYGIKNLKNIAVNDRKAIAADLLEYSKKFVQSAEFQKAYEAKRQRMKPREVTKKPKTEAQIREGLIAEAKKSIANMEETMKTATPDMKKTFEKLIEQQKKQLEEYQQPESKMITMMAQGEQMQFEAQGKRYKEDLVKWEAKYPAESSAFVKMRLQEMLKATDGIDYNAELTERNGKKYFVKQEYERKDPNWKMGFRAGKDLMESVRAYVRGWSEEIKN